MLVLCMTVAQMPEAPTPSERSACARCGEPIWVSLSTTTSMAARIQGVYTVCARCLPSDSRHRPISVLPEQVAALREKFPEDEVRELLALFGLDPDGDAPREG
jgi:hypothetical protein